ncbi:MAG: DUF1800 family protein [Bacteroidales bacterium]
MASLNPITGVLGKKGAAHLLRRATWGPGPADIEAFAALTASAALDTLFAPPAVPAPPVDVLTGDSWVNPPTKPVAIEDVNSDQDTLFNFFRAWHLEQMRKSGNNLQERITYFYHTHLPAAWSVIGSSEAVYYQNALFRYYAFGNFKTLFKKICLDNAMLRYIDGETNDKDSPNENFAREMFELYSIGRGPQLAEGNYTNYTEDDIKAACRVLTGWRFDPTFTNLDPDTSIPAGKLETENSTGLPVTELAVRHDKDPKVFTAAFGNQTIQPDEIIETLATKEAASKEFDDLIEMIFAREETARFICRKLYRFFVYWKISAEVETDIINPLATTFRTGNYEMEPVLRQLLASEHFYDTDTPVTSDNSIGALIKTPLEIIIGSLRFFDVEMPATLSDLYEKSYLNGILPMILEQGLDFYEPIDVSGYPPYSQEPTYNRDWITPNAIGHRYHFSNILMGRLDEGGDYGFQLDVVDWVRNSGNISDPSNAETLVQTLTLNLLAVEIDTDRYNYFLNDVFLDNLAPATWTTEWNLYTSGGNDDVVRAQLETLVAALMQTPEFQLF